VLHQLKSFCLTTVIELQLHPVMTEMIVGALAPAVL
jgi:hypothetical protein